MYRQPFIVGPTVDKLLGFLAGVFANVLGWIATIVVMYSWAGNDPTQEVAERRGHAASVSVWAGVGCLLPLILLVGFFLLGAGFLFSTGGGSGGGPGGFMP